MSDVIYIVGSGREALTRAARRANRFGRRALQLGLDLSVRPGRTRKIRGDIARKYPKALMEAMEAGIIRILGEDRRPFTPASFGAFLGQSMPDLVPEEDLDEDLDGDIEELGQDGDEELEGGSEPEGPASEPAEPPPPAAETTEEPPTATEPTESSEPPQDAPEGEREGILPPPGEEPTDVEVPEDAPTGEEVDPAVAAEAKAAREAQLPEDWRALTNAKLVELLEELKLPAPERINKSNLISAIDSWVEGG